MGELPYNGMSNREVSEKVPNGYRLEKPKMCPDEIYETMKKCWEIGEKISFFLQS
jgi:tyrosine kinase receptor 1